MTQALTGADPARPTPPEPPLTEPPLALVERGARGLRLLALNPAARAAGLQAGQAHADATAMVPHLISLPAEPERDLAALRRLALWAERFSPLVGIEARPPGSESLMIDMTGGAHLFGGEAALLGELRQRLARADIPARVAMADTPAAAWALARYSGRDETLAPAGGGREALAPLPVEALRLEAAALILLRRFGLRWIGDLYDLPRAGLARRFRGEAGLRVVERLDRALGFLADPLTPERPAPLYRAWQAFAEPLIDMAGIDAQLAPLTETLAGQLDRAGLGARRLSLTGFRVDGRATRIEVALSAPAAAPAHLARLLRETGLERLDLGFGLDALMLSADRAEPVTQAQGRLQGEREAAQAGALAGLIDRLQARLGEAAVRRPGARESWLPERSEIWLRAGPQAPAFPAPAALRGRERPVLLLNPPEAVETIAEAPDGAPVRFVWRRAPRRVVRAQGPERLGAEWWRQDEARPARTRDYYRVEDDQGRRYWLFREGLYGREDAERAPGWWLHGVFA
ncbi:MAG: DNA polymerase Y family protein [Caulobacteraceae bacterium]|nr:DNA polymerase Y family protein [Caulobacteraceae bacterium]